MYKNSHRAFGIALSPFVLTLSDYAPQSYHIDSIVVFLMSVVLYMVGFSFPDVDMKLKVLYSNPSQRYLYHRQYTHSVLFTGSLFYLSLYILPEYTSYYILLTAFSLGVMTHLIGDMLTGSVPWLLYAHYGKRFARIGITVFLPKILHHIFTEKFPKFLNKRLYVFIPIFLIGIYIEFDRISLLLNSFGLKFI